MSVATVFVGLLNLLERFKLPLSLLSECYFSQILVTPSSVVTKLPETEDLPPPLPNPKVPK
eukprot:4055905-Amphidinium_carterae.1